MNTAAVARDKVRFSINDMADRCTVAPAGTTGSRKSATHGSPVIRASVNAIRCVVPMGYVDQITRIPY
ncbi:hypothetical protein GCM10028792_20290 [Salinisphaera aquimarina]